MPQLTSIHHVMCSCVHVDLHALETRAWRDITDPLPEMATQAQWNSEKYSSTWSRWMSTDASVYLTPVSGSTWSSRFVGSTTSELHWKWTPRAWATRQWRVAGLDLIRYVSTGSFRNTGKANLVGSPCGRTLGSSLPLPSPPPKAGGDCATDGARVDPLFVGSKIVLARSSSDWSGNKKRSSKKLNHGSKSANT